MQMIVLTTVAIMQLLPFLVGVVVDHVANEIQPELNLCGICAKFALLLLASLIEECEGFGFGRYADMLTRISTVEYQVLALDLRINDALVEYEDLGTIAALQLVIRHLKLAHLTELALVIHIELQRIWS